MLGNFNQWIDTISQRQSIFETCVSSQFQEIIPILERSRHNKNRCQGRNLGLSTHGLASPESMFLGGAAVHEPWLYLAVLSWELGWRFLEVDGSWWVWDVSNAGVVEFIRTAWRKCLTCKNNWTLRILSILNGTLNSRFYHFCWLGLGVDHRKATNACALRQVSFWGSKYSYLSSRRGLIYSNHFVQDQALKTP